VIKERGQRIGERVSIMQGGDAGGSAYLQVKNRLSYKQAPRGKEKRESIPSSKGKGSKESTLKNRSAKGIRELCMMGRLKKRIESAEEP